MQEIKADIFLRSPKTPQNYCLRKTERALFPSLLINPHTRGKESKEKLLKQVELGDATANHPKETECCRMMHIYKHAANFSSNRLALHQKDTRGTL